MSDDTPKIPGFVPDDDILSPEESGGIPPLDLSNLLPVAEIFEQDLPPSLRPALEPECPFCAAPMRRLRLTRAMGLKALQRHIRGSEPVCTNDACPGPLTARGRGSDGLF